MKARVRTRIVIHAEPAAVFKYLRDTQYHHLWNPNLKSIQPITSLLQDGEYETSSVVLGVRIRGMNQVQKLIPDQELEIVNQTGMVKYSVNFRLEENAGATRLICTTVVSSEGKAFAFAKPMLEHLARRELNTDLKALKTVVEAKIEA